MKKSAQSWVFVSDQTLFFYNYFSKRQTPFSVHEHLHYFATKGNFAFSSTNRDIQEMIQQPNTIQFDTCCMRTSFSDFKNFNYSPAEEISLMENQL